MMRRLATMMMATALALGGCQASSDVSRSLGARCDSDGDCDDRCLEPSTTYPGGMCTSTCELDSDCPFDTHCIDDEGGVCLYGCQGDGDCTFLGAGWTCQMSTEEGVNPGQVTPGQVGACRGG